MTKKEIRQVMERYIDCSYQDLLNHAVENFFSLMNELLTKHYSDPEPEYVHETLFSVNQIARLAVHSDRKVADQEKRFVKDLCSYPDMNPDGSPLLVEELVLSDFKSKKAQDELEQLIVELFKLLTPEGKVSALNFISTFLTVDKDLDRAEVRFLSKLVKLF